jgi:hypothetical protein
MKHIHFCNIQEKNGIQTLLSMLGEQLIGHVCPFHIGILDAWCGHKVRIFVAEWYTSKVIDETPQSHFDGNFYVKSNKRKIKH